MLSQAIYWSTVTTDPEGWFYKKAADWTAETGLTERNQESARRHLRGFDFWQEERRGAQGVLHFRLDLEKLAAELATLSSTKPARKRILSNQDHAKCGNRIEQNACSRVADSRSHYMEAESTHKELGTEKERIPPTPLCSDDSAESDSRNETERLKQLHSLLKDGMLNDSYQSANLDMGDYDRYFRDSSFCEVRGNVIIVDGTDRGATFKGLQRYQRRLSRLSERVFGREMKFELSPVSDGSHSDSDTALRACEIP